jgi:hypothetical protein
MAYPSRPSGRVTFVSGLIKRLRNMGPALIAIGKQGVAISQKAFQEEAWDGKRWEQRYPNLPDDEYINIAGAVSDLNKGIAPKRRRFDRRPVLQDEGELRSSVDSRVVSSTTVEIGVFGGERQQIAATHQRGGISKQRVTQTARDTLAEVMRKVRKRTKRPKNPRRMESVADQDRAVQREGRIARAQIEKKKLAKLGFIFQVDEVETHVVERHFVGMTPEYGRKIHGIVLAYAEGRRV